MSSISTPSPTPPSIIPSMPSLDFSGGTGDVVTGLPLAITFFIIGIIFFTELGAFIIMYIFGNPIFIAYSSTGKALIQHFNTPKSAVLKTARISGEAFQYQNIRDGTVAATSKSVLGVGNKQMVMTFANFGATIPIDVLAGVSVLMTYGIKNFLDLKNKFTNEKIIINPTNDEKILSYELTNDAENTVLVKGYDFENFNNLLDESKKEKLIPLMIEAVPNYVEKNINSDYNEVIITYNKAANSIGKPTDDSLMKLGSIVFMILILLLLQTVIK